MHIPPNILVSVGGFAVILVGIVELNIRSRAHVASLTPAERKALEEETLNDMQAY